MNDDEWQTQYSRFHPCFFAHGKNPDGSAGYKITGN
jgi:hypothetical protein